MPRPEERSDEGLRAEIISDGEGALGRGTDFFLKFKLHVNDMYLLIIS